ncbi:MAG: DUF998 domain-containing protein [Luteimonas sp.]
MTDTRGAYRKNESSSPRPRGSDAQPQRDLKFAAVAGALLFSAAVLGFGSAIDGYSQLRHPVALLGATGIPGAAAFNLIAFVIPGLVAVCIAWQLRSRLQRDAAWPARIGASLALLSALAFAAQGLFAMDPANLDAPASRWHYVTWMLWWIAYVPAGLLLAAGVRGVQRWHVFAAASAATAVVVGVCALLPADVLPAGIVQRIGFLAWLSWCCMQPESTS